MPGYALRIAAAALLISLSILSSCAHGPSGKSPLTVEERLALAGAYEEKGLADLAEKEYKAALDLDNKNASVYFRLANLGLKAKDYAGAEANYRKALEIEPENPLFHNNLGWLYMEKGEMSRAKDEVREAARLDPGRMYIYLDTLAVIQMREGGYADSEENLLEASRLIPEGERQGLKEIYGHLIELYKETGESAKEEEAAKKLKALQAPPPQPGGKGR